MMKYMFIALILVAVMVGCTETSNKITTNAVVCDKDYTFSGKSCCLDKNYNDICDVDETTEEESVEEAPKLLKEFFTDLAERILPKPENLLEYHNTPYGIKIKYPEEWEKVESGDVVVEFLSPLEELDTFRENLNIMVQDLPNQMSIGEYTDISLYHIGRMFDESKLDSSSDTVLAGYPAHEIVHNGKYYDYTLKWLQVYTIINNKAYLITYTSEKDKYDDYLWIVSDMIDSFEIVLK